MFLDGFDPDALRLILPAIFLAVSAIAVGALGLAIWFTRWTRATGPAGVSAARARLDPDTRRHEPPAYLRDLHGDEPRMVRFSEPAAKGFRRDPVVGRDIFVGERRVRVVALNRRR